ncbi:DUF7695 domain-containing protein [Bifidobacterium biavatii]|uniref:DUF7695 domain-containing protein n=1 Tax=Bifidobacterium biavatii DSM 23969 TaxID=1437608 RepID=A0A086Z5W9_9BIFI|nr:hypothetical protein [Bifidobacterium biavatii]KFI41919.1 hypothetical protein BBIA_2540 [Bifidobacterium biavatii DSM 23969]
MNEETESTARRRIIRNSARCKRCGSEIESRYTWEYVTCACGAISIDGGHEYCRQVGYLDLLEDTSITKP